jgi:anti-sigma regulatory factor (Ser/Thr protein kinase)
VAEPALLQRSSRLDPVPASAGEARRVVHDALTEVGELDLRPSAELAVSELVTNAILHAATTVELTVEVTADSITVRVRDWHDRLPLQRDAETTATTGRGLAIVAAVSDAHGVEVQPPSGKAVWFRLRRGN